MDDFKKKGLVIGVIFVLFVSIFFVGYLTGNRNVDNQYRNRIEEFRNELINQTEINKRLRENQQRTEDNYKQLREQFEEERKYYTELRKQIDRAERDYKQLGKLTTENINTIERIRGYIIELRKILSTIFND